MGDYFRNVARTYRWNLAIIVMQFLDNPFIGLQGYQLARNEAVVDTSLKGMDYYETQCYDHNRRLFTLIGLWPYQESSSRFRRACLVTITIIMLCVLQTYLIFTSELKIGPITDLMQTYLPTLCFACCYFNLLYNSSALKLLLDRLRADPDELTNQEEKDIMYKYANQSRLCSLAMSYAFYCYVGLLIFPSFWGLHLNAFEKNDDTQLLLPFPVEYCLQNRIRYFFMLLLECVGISIIYTVGIAHYSMVISSVQHACVLFSIVAMKIDRPFKASECDYSLTTSSTGRGNENDWIIAVIKYYSEAIRFVELLRMVFGTTYFIELLLVLLLIIIDFVYLFQLLDSMPSMNEAIKNIIFIIGSLVLIYAVFYVAQRLINHSTDVYAKCCQIPFYALSTKTQKLLLLLIMRSLKPCSFNVSGIMVTSNEVFAKIANTSYSFAIVFYNTR